ncbi:hypothetical protein [Streptomyces sp. NBC_01244]|uniref:hypothetical protein n=1 Tax=Streptomyces sp. NBC_01244 TaxID=2903797 RepID=UPI002E1385EE|nr:hypothetical protein OG247_31890 [Streptomyces sp. NBC_01244]
MLCGLLGIHADLVFAERNIDFQLDRLRQFTSEGREIGPFAAGHILDCAQRLSQSVTARDAHTKALTAALQGLRRNESPAATVPAPAARTAPAARAH